MCGLISTAHAADLCTGQSYDVGGYADFIAAADFNADSRLDLVTANSDFSNVSVLIGDGEGRFLAAKTFGVGTRPQALAVADFNGDAKPDIVTANTGSNNVSVLLNNGAGDFIAATNYSVGVEPRSVAAGDFNGDGKLDLAVPIAYSSNIRILAGNGAGGFAPLADVTHAGGSFVTVADLNSDGKADLVVGHSGFGSLSILLGNGAGGFGAATDIQIGQAPDFVAVGDLNSDGKLDLVTKNVSSFPHQIAVLQGNGAGGFSQPAYYAVGNHPSSISIGDFDNDGKADIGVANQTSRTVSILLGNGTGSFATAQNYETGGASSLASGDFNSDGRLDLAVAYATVTNLGKVSILFNSCNAIPAPGTPPAPVPTYSISGRVTNGRFGFTFLKLSGTQGGTAGIDSNGNYTFPNLPSGGTYTVTPYDASNIFQYTFSPPSRTVAKLGSNQTLDFTQTLVSNSISGKVADANGVGIAGITVVLNMNPGNTRVTDSSGDYSFNGLASGQSYRVGPASLDYTFTPSAIDVVSLNGDVIANFTAIPLYDITGRITDQNGAGVSGVSVSVMGPMSRSTTSDSNGNYLINDLPAGGNYIMNLSKASFVFDPPGKTFNNLNGHQTANFIAIPAFNISGRITLASGYGISGVTVTLSGSYPSGTPYTATTMTFNSGGYNFSFLAAGGTYTITPSKSGYTFQPENLTFKKLSADQIGSDFIGIPPQPHLILEESGSEPGSAVAIDSLLFLRDSFPIVNGMNLFYQGADKNTRVIIFLKDLQLASGQPSSSVVVNLTDSTGISYDVAAEDVRLVPLFTFTQVRFRLPDTLTPGTYTIKVKANGLESNSGTIRIRN